jgi:hypothetical protein
MKKERVFFICLIISGVLWTGGAVWAMPVGTLLYRTASDGKMYGYNTGELFEPLAISSNKELEVMRINSGHVGIYVGKVDGEDKVLEAIDNGVQLTPAKYFIDTGLGEQLLGAKIPRGLNEHTENSIRKLALALADDNLNYDWSFSAQKGPDSGQWTCVGTTEKIYESLTSNLVNDNVDASNVIKKLIYDPANYAINITPDGFDDSNIFNKYTGDCLAKKKEFSSIAKRSWEPAYTVGKVTGGERYFFLPYTQFIQPSLDNVDVNITVASDFVAEKIRGSVPYGEVIVLAVKNMTVNDPLAVTEVLLNALTPYSNYLSLAEEFVSVGVSAIIDSFSYSSYSSNTGSLATTNDSSENNYSSAGEKSSAVSSPASSSKSSTGEVLAEKTVAATTKKTKISTKKSKKKTETTASSSKTVLLADKTASSSSEKTALTAIQSASSSSAALENSIKTASSSTITLKTSTSTSSIAKSSVINSVYPIAANVSSGSEENSSEPESPPFIASFSLYDSSNSSTSFTKNNLAAVRAEIGNASVAMKYSLTEASGTAELVWVDVLPTQYKLSAGDGAKNVLFWLKDSYERATSALASIILDTAAPTAVLSSLPARESEASFTVVWRGSDVSSGVATYDVDYSIGTSSEKFSWQSWLKKTSATSSGFSQTVPEDDYVSFRVRAIDRAGNIGGWSSVGSVKIASKKTYEHTALISEFAIAGPTGAADEFIELYNPGKKSFSLAGWSVQTKSYRATSSWINRAPDGGFLEGAVIPAQGYFLIVSEKYSLSVGPDYRHDASFSLTSAGGSIRVLDESGNEIDSINFGGADDSGSVLASADIPSGYAAERKALATSTSDLMIYPGEHSLWGNGYDTDSGDDFVINNKANPQNSSSASEPPSLVTIKPFAISDLSVDQQYLKPHEMKIIWSSPPFANLESKGHYIIKYAFLSDRGCSLEGTWDKASSVSAEIIPVPAMAGGETQELIVSDLLPGEKYCFAIKTFNGYNTSAISNIASGYTEPIISSDPDIQIMVDQEEGSRDSFLRCGIDDEWSGQSFVATQNNISGFKVFSAGIFGGSPYDSLIELCDNVSDNYGYFCASPIKSEYLPESEIYTFAYPAQLIIGHSYLIKIHSRGYAYAKNIIYSKNDPYSDGSAYDIGNEVAGSDLQIQIYYDRNFQP